MSDQGPTDEQRKSVYIALLRGIARDIREAPGSCDRIGHDWSEWRQSVLDKCLPLGPPALSGAVFNETFRVKSERHCLQCGKEQAQ